MTFQSTLPRGSDEQQHSAIARGLLFNPRSLAGATYVIKLGRSNAKFSIHAPSRERRVAADHSVMYVYVFNPRSLAGATKKAKLKATATSFSIHAPSRERQCWAANISITGAFQSTLPRGSDALRICIFATSLVFQSTLPRGSDLANPAPVNVKGFSIHAPSRERLLVVWLNLLMANFQSTLPRGSDRRTGKYIACSRHFQSTLPRGSDIKVFNTCFHLIIFNPRSLAGATVGVNLYAWSGTFSIHAPSRERQR